MNTASLVLGWVMTATLAVVMPFVAHDQLTLAVVFGLISFMAGFQADHTMWWFSPAGRTWRGVDRKWATVERHLPHPSDDDSSD